MDVFLDLLKLTGRYKKPVFVYPAPAGTCRVREWAGWGCDGGGSQPARTIVLCWAAKRGPVVMVK